MAYKVKMRFIGTNHKEYKTGDMIPDDLFDEKYITSLKNAGYIKNAENDEEIQVPLVGEISPENDEEIQVPNVQVPLVGDISPESMAVTVGSVGGTDVITPEIDEQEIGTVAETLPDPTLNKIDTVVDGAGDYHLPVGTVDGDAPTETMPEASVVGTVEPTTSKKGKN